MKITALSSEFVYSVPKLSLMQRLGPEVCFIGRSNAGKSSLINALCNNNDLARTSKTPGRTRHAVVYHLVWSTSEKKKPLILVDMPGFGFALMSKTEAAACEKLIFSYLTKRRELAAVVLLLDIRRKIDAREEQIIAIAKERNLHLLLVLTKSDKLAGSKRKPARLKVALDLDIDPSSILLHSIDDVKTTVAVKKAIYEAV